MDSKFKSLWQHKTKRSEETVKKSELDALPKKTPDYQHDAILTDALDPPSMFYTEWETPLTENDESSDNTKILQSVPTLPK